MNYSSQALLELPQGNSAVVARAASASRLAQVDKLYDDFCSRLEKGEKIDPDAYCARFPSMYSALYKALQVHLFMEERFSTEEIRWPVAGEKFLDYDLKLELGKGAFARVFLATESKLGGRLVAVKIARHGAAEADVLGRIKHPNIVPVHSVHEDQASGLTAVCMPYVGRATLCDVLDKAFGSSATADRQTHPLAPTDARVILEAAQDVPFPLDPSAHAAAPDSILRRGTYVDGIRLIGAQLAEALAYIHANGLQHRDLKPSNVLLSPQGTPLLLDFNLCADSRRLVNRLGGTMPYMSPEQLLAADVDKTPAEAAALDTRSDIFSLGVILYEMVTGLNPFGPLPLKLSSADLRRHLLQRHQEGVVPARNLNPDVDAEFSTLIQSCLALDPKDRPKDAAAIAVSLRGALAALPRAKRWLAKHPKRVIAAALVLTALSLVSVSLAAMRTPYSERQVESGLRLAREGRYREAVRHFNEALEAEPNNAAARLARGHAHQQLGDFNMAMQDYLEVDKRTPDGRAKAAYGYCLSRTDAPSEVALEYHLGAAKAGFENAAVYNNQGYSYLRLGDKRCNEARACLDRAIELDPKLQAAYHNRARVALKQALSARLKFVPAAKESAHYRSLLAGITDARKAFELGEANAELHLDVARLCALASMVEPKWAPESMASLENYLKHGGNPTTCKDADFRTLPDQAALLKLALRPYARQAPVPTRRLVDPLETLSE